MSNKVHSIVVDHGNSKIKVASFNSEKELIQKETFDTEDKNDAIDFIKSIDTEKAIYASTNHADSSILKCLQRFKSFYHFTHASEFPIELDYKTPETLGIDRIANACAAYFLFPKKNALIIDVGTCITYDFIDSNGIYRGGAISPGPELRSKSMNDYTAKLPLVDFEIKSDVLGKSTVSSLNSGIFRGILFEIDGYSDSLRDRLGELTIILTGGYTSLFASDVKNTIFADSNFTLKGLNEILLYHAGY